MIVNLRSDSNQIYRLQAVASDEGEGRQWFTHPLIVSWVNYVPSWEFLHCMGKNQTIPCGRSKPTDRDLGGVEGVEPPPPHFICTQKFKSIYQHTYLALRPNYGPKLQSKICLSMQHLTSKLSIFFSFSGGGPIDPPIWEAASMQRTCTPFLITSLIQIWPFHKGLCPI